MSTSRVGLSGDPRSEAKKPVAIQLRWGQVPTPDGIAIKMAERLLRNRTAQPINILDPCVGLATFPRALARAGMLRDKDEITLFNIDPKMIAESSKWARKQGLRFTAECADYVGVALKPEYDYAIFNG
jgi:hypothetical protein